MAIQLVAGQTIAADYTLLHPIEGKSSAGKWLAVQESTQERVQLEAVANTIDATATNARLDQLKALIHPNILASYAVVPHDGEQFIVSAFKRGLEPLDLEQPLTQLWPQLKVIIDALEYAHSFGFAHGHIRAENCLVGDDGTPYVAGFGLSATAAAPERSVTPRADIFGIAQLLISSLGDAPVEPDLANVLKAMSAEDPAQRPENFAGLTEVIARSDQHTEVAITDFSRPDTQPTSRPEAPVATAHRLPRERSVVSLPMVVMGLVLLGVIAAGLFLFLPQSVTPPEVADSQVAGNKPVTVVSPDPSSGEVILPTPELAPLELAKLEELKQQGVELAAELLRRQVEVEDIGGRLWAGERYDQSTELGISGDEAYRESQFAEAVAQYQQGIDLLTEVLAEADEVFANNLAKGEQALLVGDFTTAITAFEIVTKIKPADSDLAAQLVRATNLEQVVRLSQDADVLERNGEWLEALQAFQAAVDIDAKWQPAQDGIVRINQQIDRNRFQDEMTLGFEAIAAKRFTEAEQAFERAQKILPASTEPLDGLQQITLAKVQTQIEQLNQQIGELELAGNWQDAIPVYEKILSLSPGLDTATAGLANARQQADLKATLQRFISEPQLMQSDDELKAAKSALIAAAQAGELFRAEARDLSHLVSLARIDVTVRLTSDQRTDVTVYQVGRYGPIREVELSLVPGVYTFVGKRSGYRDVYQEVHIKGDQNPMNVDIRCSEKI